MKKKSQKHPLGEKSFDEYLRTFLKSHVSRNTLNMKNPFLLKVYIEYVK
jgi:hypothetical protein